MTIQELMEEQRKRVRSCNPAERLAATLLIPTELSRRLRLLGNSEIAQLLDDEVCENMSILAPEATVCVEAALRLRRATGRQPMPFVIRSLLKSLLILIVFVPVMAALPLAAIAMTRTPEGAETWFWIAPWSCCFWVLIYSQLSAAPWRQGADAVRQWRAEHGGLLVASAKATVWMFGALFFSYVAEGALLFTTRSFGMLPLATYSPLTFA